MNAMINDDELIEGGRNGREGRNIVDLLMTN